MSGGAGDSQQRIAAARAAYATGDVEQSRVAHARNLGLLLPGVQQHEGSTSKLDAYASGVCSNSVCEAGHAPCPTSVWKCATYGSVDGLALFGALLSACAAAGLDTTTSFHLLTAASAGLALAHGLRDYVRFRHEAQHFDRERRREAWELRNYREGEEAEMVQLYVERGVKREDAATAITALAKHSEFFVDLMMTQELGLPIPDADPRNAGLASSFSFAATSLIPSLVLSSFFSWKGVELTALWPFSSSVGAGAAAASPVSAGAEGSAGGGLARLPLALLTHPLLVTLAVLALCWYGASAAQTRLCKTPHLFTAWTVAALAGTFVAAAVAAYGLALQ